jgi:TonB family protein
MKLFFGLIAVAMLGTGTLLAVKEYAPKFDGEKIRAHVKLLSSDALEGRGMNQKGGDEAAEYIAAQFKSYGLKPAGENGTYFQSVPMVGVKTLPATTFSFAPSSGAAVDLKILDDYVTTDEMQQESAEIDAPIVFVGYGINAPEYQWDDYKGYDLKGKVALLFVNEPVSTDPKFFKANALTYYGRWTYKFEETARRGAIATLIIHRTELASYPWEVVRNSWGGEKSFLKLDGTPKLEAASWINLETAKKLAAMSGQDVDKMFQQAQSRDFKPVELPVRLKGRVVSQIRPFTGRNVLGMVEGADGARKAEAVLYTAHFDHFGIDTTRAKGDQIYHGAIDNATGCGILLELARVWAGTKPAPPRSILFAAVTAEEQGLLGSEYLGKHTAQLPVQPILDLNYDALAPIGIPEEVEVSGAERTTFYPEVEPVSKKFGLAIKPDAHPEAGHYYRSDHFSLGRVGIPAFSISEGMKFKSHDLAWGEAWAKDYTDNHYHKPADIFRDDWNFEGLAKMAHFGYELGKAAANQEGEIQWLPGDEFGPAYKKLHSARIDGDAVFAGHPELQPVSLEPIQYPPLARQTRITGTVVFNVLVAEDGAVKRIERVSGPPLLRDDTEQCVKQWKFVPQPGTERDFTLSFEFGFTNDLNYEFKTEVLVRKPLYIAVLAGPRRLEPTRF